MASARMTEKITELKTKTKNIVNICTFCCDYHSQSSRVPHA